MRCIRVLCRFLFNCVWDFLIKNVLPIPFCDRQRVNECRWQCCHLLGTIGCIENDLLKSIINYSLFPPTGNNLSDDDTESVVSREASPCAESPQPVSVGSESPNENICNTLNTLTSVATSTTANNNNTIGKPKRSPSQKVRPPTTIDDDHRFYVGHRLLLWVWQTIQLKFSVVIFF